MIEDLKLRPTVWWIVDELIARYGSDITLGELFLHLTQDRGYRCPKCGGKGFVTIEAVDFYGYDIEYRDKECDLCKGTGFTDKQMKPKMVQDGWEEV